MHNKVVYRAASALNDAGLITLRVNFRGVGLSSGEFDAGRGELEDARDALTFLQQRYSDQKLTVCGFSFGALVGMNLGIEDQRVSYLISLGTPVEKYDFAFLQHCRKPILFVHGERDQFGEVRKLQTIVSQLEAETDVQLTVIPGADHFFEGHLDELKETITSWIRDRIEPASRG